MTDPTPAPLTPFEGKPVLGVGIEIPGAAGGLRDALTIDPIEAHHDDEVVVVLVTNVSKLRFDPIKDTDGWRRVHVLDVKEGMIVDKELVAEHLAKQRERLAELKLAREGAERGGVITFPTDEELHTAHMEGEHAEALIEGCVDCDNELRALATETVDKAKVDPDLKAALGKAVDAAVDAAQQSRPNPAKATADKKAAAKKAAAKKAPAAKKAAPKKPAGS